MNTTVRGADRALMIFEAFEAAKRQLSLRDLATRCDLPVSSCHGIVQTLLQRGYLYSFGRRKELYPNRRIYSLAKTIVDNDPFLARIAADLEALRNECNETVTVSKRQGDLLQYIYTLDSLNPVRYAAKPGDVRPLHSTANGKALLCAMNDGELRHWLERQSLEAQTEKTITSKETLLRQIETARKQGYVIAAGEYSPDLDAVAVPVLLHDEVITISLAGPTSRVGPRLSEFAQRLLALKKKLETGEQADPQGLSLAIGGSELTTD
ncbi:IclR family transcriptional regulator [uncultured Pigmentiphaga sp.]|uniref:IclR family transcriptional regulator n=1 Tax=uncultured Pigmentiphaga sp. TaxID=340361 RepID=UPI0026331395|nr:IclR family transcriptional regulator [uncultured Pigmentiphaga sp.]